MFSLTASWGSPLEQKITAYFSDLVWESDMQQIFKSFPRDCFDENGYFIKPSTSVEVSEEIGIKPSISSFIDKVLSKKKYQFEFNNSSLTSELLLKNIYWFKFSLTNMLKIKKRILNANICGRNV